MLLDERYVFVTCTRTTPTWKLVNIHFLRLKFGEEIAWEAVRAVLNGSGLGHQSSEKRIKKQSPFSDVRPMYIFYCTYIPLWHFAENIININHEKVKSWRNHHRNLNWVLRKGYSESCCKIPFELMNLCIPH